MLVETARLWRSLGHNDGQGQFRIDGVTGPDEYSALADNNVYTNLMAQHNMLAAADAAARHHERARALGVGDEEVAAWRDAAAAIFIPYDDELGVHPQDDAFTEHQVWDFAATPKEHYPLLLHVPYFDLYRKQVVKQPDLVLAMHLHGDAFTRSRRNETSRTTSGSPCETRRWPPVPRQSSRPKWATWTSPTITSVKPPAWTWTISSTTRVTASTWRPWLGPGLHWSMASEGCGLEVVGSHLRLAYRRG